MVGHERDRQHRGRFLRGDITLVISLIILMSLYIVKASEVSQPKYWNEEYVFLLL